jgi:hypothetical protein
VHGSVVSVARRTHYFLAPQSRPFRVMTVSPPITGLTVVRVLCVMFGLRAHRVGPPVNLGFDAQASLSQ